MMWFEREYSWFTETLLSLRYWNKFENEVCALKHHTLRWPELGALAYNVFQVKQKDIMESKSPQSAPAIFFNWNEITGQRDKTTEFQHGSEITLLYLFIWPNKHGIVTLHKPYHICQTGENAKSKFLANQWILVPNPSWKMLRKKINK